MFQIESIQKIEEHRRHRPADRINNHERLKRRMVRKYEPDPRKTYAANADERNDSRHQRVAVTAHRAGEDVDEYGEYLGHDDIDDAYDTDLDDSGIGVEYAQQRTRG